MLRTVLIIVVSLLSANVKAEHLMAEELYNLLITNYQQMVSYTDQGSYQANYYEDGVLQHSEEKIFKTFYKHPDKFKLEWIDIDENSLPRYNVLWRSGTLTKKLLWKQNLESYENFTSAISSIAGVSGRVSYLIPAFLYEDVPTPKIKKLTVSENISDENGGTMVKLELRYTNDRIDCFWVDTTEHLIRKVENIVKSQNQLIVQTIHYEEIEYNSPILESEFSVDLDKVKELQKQAE